MDLIKSMFFVHLNDMGYYHYHGIIKTKIKEGKLIKYELVEHYHHISPALVLYFSDGQVKPIREYRFHEYFILLDEWERNHDKIKKKEIRHMGFRAVDHSITVVTVQKNQKRAGMTCAWAMQVDYDKLVLLLGSQSDTASMIAKGDKIGISVLNKDQSDIALHFGEQHSKEKDKFEGIDFHELDGVLTIPDACREMKAEVMEIYHLPEIEEDHLIYVRILSHQDAEHPFLHMGEIK